MRASQGGRARASDRRPALRSAPCSSRNGHGRHPLSSSSAASSGVHQHRHHHRHHHHHHQHIITATFVLPKPTSPEIIPPYSACIPCTRSRIDSTPWAPLLKPSCGIFSIRLRNTRKRATISKRAASWQSSSLARSHGDSYYVSRLSPGLNMRGKRTLARHPPAAPSAGAPPPPPASSS